ncbi:hypothetical protein QAD02_001096 [Eretmocerus hayati]|uniref:Uncharacterized protein n=1 Tax=Eretmocerus hayati TaxID=131215 RepID=A0ACC2NHW6_9HYME|nr:hypothetical protein QAD02_001096 [Eretmocerus hayati]
MAFSQIFVRLLMLRIYNRDIGELIAEARKDFDANNYTTEERKIFMSYHVKSKRYMTLLIANTAFTATSFYAKPLLGQMGEVIDYATSKNHGNSSLIFILPYQFYTFYEINDAPTYFWTYASQLPFVFVSGFGQGSADCIMVALVCHVSGQMAVLATRIRKINTDSALCTEDIYRIVEHHIRLLRMGKTMENAFSIILLANLIGATALICVLGYGILLSLALGETANLVPLMAFIILVLLILYIHCTIGESLITESENVTEAFYDCRWYDMSIENAKIILMCMVRSQKPLQLTAGKLKTFCHTTLTETLKASMGYLSVLRQVM